MKRNTWTKKTNKGATHKRNPPGTKIAGRHGSKVQAFHGGSLTKLNKARAARRLAMWGV